MPNRLRTSFTYVNMIKSATRVLDVLEVLAASPVPVGVSEISRRLTIPKSSTSSLLNTLLLRGYVARNGARLYELNSALADGWVGGFYPRLVSVARPVMANLVNRVGESVFLGVLMPDWQVQYLAKVVSPKEVRYDAEISTRRPAHCTSTGKVLLAFRTETDLADFLARAPLRRFTNRTITSPTAFRAELARIRRNGYAVNVDERVAGASGVAAPIFDRAGKVVAALNISAPTSRFITIQAKTSKAAVRASTEISGLLGMSVQAERHRRSRSSP